MARSHPKDRFDSVPDSLLRVGAHRAPPRRRSGWIVFAWAAFATGILIAIGVVWLYMVNNRIQFVEDPGSRDSRSAPSPSTQSAAPSAPPPSAPAVPTPTAPVVDKTVTITVVNGSSKTGLATATVRKVIAAGWSPDTVAATGSDSDVEKTTVYYSDASREQAARSLAQTLDGVAVAKSNEYKSYGTQLIAVLGADFAAR